MEYPSKRKGNSQNLLFPFNGRGNAAYQGLEQSLEGNKVNSDPHFRQVFNLPDNYLWKSDTSFTVHKNGSTGGAYFEITVQNLGETNVVTIGVCTSDYPPHGKQPGWEVNSVGYHGDDGKLFVQTGQGVSCTTPWQEGDRIGCGVKFGTGEVFFTRNGNLVKVAAKLTGTYHFCLGFRSLHAKILIHSALSDMMFDIIPLFSDGSKRIAAPQPQNSVPPPSSNQPTQQKSKSAPLRVAVLICNACLSIEFPGCGDHKLLVNVPVGDDARCPAPGCDISTAISWRICRFCKKQRPQLRMMYLYREEVAFVYRAIQKERSGIVKMACLVCPSCKVFAFPGKRSGISYSSGIGSDLITSADITQNPGIGEQLLMANAENFKHRGECYYQATLKTFGIPKSEIEFVAEYYDRSYSNTVDESIDELTKFLKLMTGHTQQTSQNKVTECCSLRQITDVISNNTTVVLNLGCPQWCGHCVDFIPHFAKLSGEYKTVTFLSVDCDNVPDASRHFSANAYPTFKIFHSAAEKKTIVGGGGYALQQIRATLEEVNTQQAPVCLPGKIANPSASGSHYLVAVGSEERDMVVANFSQSIASAYENMKFSVKGVQKIVNSNLTKRFNQKREQWKANGYSWSAYQSVPAYHCSHPSNIASICENNVLMKKTGKTDEGWFGKGLYFSGCADYTFCYNSHGNGNRPIRIGETGKVLVFDVLLGKKKKLQGLKNGGDLETGYDSHESPLGFEWVIFNSDQCLPRYIIEFTAAPGIKVVNNGKTYEDGT